MCNCKKYLAIIFLLFVSIALVAMPDSTFIRNYLNEYERQRPRLERKIKKRIKQLEGADTIILIPTLEINKSKDFYPDFEAIWDAIDVKSFPIHRFVVFNSRGGSYVYEWWWTYMNQSPKYEIMETIIHEELINLIHERNPSVVFQISAFPEIYFFIENKQLVICLITDKGFECYFGGSKDLERIINEVSWATTYGFDRRMVH